MVYYQDCIALLANPILKALDRLGSPPWLEFTILLSSPCTHLWLVTGSKAELVSGLARDGMELQQVIRGQPLLVLNLR